MFPQCKSLENGSTLGYVQGHSVLEYSQEIEEDAP